MKLVYCTRCEDLVRLVLTNWRTCLCGQSGGRYRRDELTAHIFGPCVPIGIGNASFQKAREKRTRGPGPGTRFLAFVIPEVCETIVVKKRPPKL